MTDDPPSIRPASPEDREAALRIGALLPEWFTQRGLAMMRSDFPFQRLLVAVVGGEVVGFVSFFVYERVGRIAWMGVVPALRRRGTGAALLRSMGEMLRLAGVEAVVVDTLGDSVDYEPYAETRAFYRALGFTDHERVMQDDPECPERLTLRLGLG